MLGGKGYFRGGSLLVSGTAGPASPASRRISPPRPVNAGEHCIYFAFEESPDQIVRNMRSIGIDLAPGSQMDCCTFRVPAGHFGLEIHLRTMQRLIDEIDPQVIVVDPVSSFIAAGTELDAKSMLMRLIDLLKTRKITALLTSLTEGGHPVEQSEIGISSLIDTWLMMRNIEQAGERTRTLSVVKSRGMKHSNQTRELRLTDNGVELAEVFVGPDGGILTGSARISQEAADRAASAALLDEITCKRAALQRRRGIVEARIAELQADLAAEEAEVGAAISLQTTAASELAHSRTVQARERETGSEPQGGSDERARQ